MKTKARKLPIVGLLLISLAACQSKEPGEDAVATVDGYEITATELNNEIAALGGQNNRDPETRRQALDQLINRKLLVSLARERDLDQTPSYILNEQRTRELLLADAAVGFLSTLSPATDKRKVAEAAAATGNERIKFQVEGVQLKSVTNLAVMKSIQEAPSMAEVQKILSDAKIPATATSLNWDSLAMPVKLVEQLQTVPSGKPFVLSSPEGVFVGVVTGEQRQSLTLNQSRELAQSILDRNGSQITVTDWLKKAKAKATIIYSKGESSKLKAVERESPK